MLIPRVEVRVHQRGLDHAQSYARRDEVLQLDQLLTVKSARHKPQKPKDQIGQRQGTVERVVKETTGGDISVCTKNEDIVPSESNIDAHGFMLSMKPSTRIAEEDGSHTANTSTYMPCLVMEISRAASYT